MTTIRVAPHKDKPDEPGSFTKTAKLRLQPTLFEQQNATVISLLVHYISHLLRLVSWFLPSNPDRHSAPSAQLWVIASGAVTRHTHPLMFNHHTNLLLHKVRRALQSPKSTFPSSLVHLRLLQHFQFPNCRPVHALNQQAMPLTPSTSDNEFSLPSPRFNPRRAAMQPLSIQNSFLHISRSSSMDSLKTAPIPSRSSLIPGSRLRLLLHQGVMFLLFFQTWQPRYHLSTTEKQQNALHYNILLRPFSSSHHHTFAYTMPLSSCSQTFLTSTLR